jgi:prophage maintenance system killer protein
LDGIKDINLIESAVASPQQLFSHSAPTPDAFDLAASYGFGIVRSNEFNDGKTYWLDTSAFILADNGIKIQFTPQDAIDINNTIIEQLL